MLTLPLFLIGAAAAKILAPPAQENVLLSPCNNAYKYGFDNHALECSQPVPGKDQAVKPPSTMISVPVTKDASAPAR